MLHAHWPRFSFIELAHNRRMKLTLAVLMVHPSWSCNWTKVPVAWVCAPGCKRMVCFASRSGTRFTDARRFERKWTGVSALCPTRNDVPLEHKLQTLQEPRVF